MASQLGTTMRAAAHTSVSGGMDKNLKLDPSHPLPKNATSLPKDSTLVKVAYAALNPVDFKLSQIPILGGLLFAKGIPGLDFAGTVVATTLPHLKPGEPVFGKLDPPNFGTCAEYVVTPASGTIPLPDGISMRDAATLGVAGLTAYQTFIPFVPPGSKVFFNGGSGGVGTFQIQLAKAYGCHVTTTCSGANVELCKSLGADEVIDYRTTDVVAALARKGTQFDVVVDNVFADAALYWNCHKYLKPEGTFVTIAGEAKFGTIKNFLSIFLWPRVLGGGQRKFAFVTAEGNPEHYAQIARWMGEGKVKPVIEQTYDLADVGAAYSRLMSGRTRGKLVVKVA